MLIMKFGLKAHNQDKRDVAVQQSCVLKDGHRWQKKNLFVTLFD